MRRAQGYALQGWLSIGKAWEYLIEVTSNAALPVFSKVYYQSISCSPDYQALLTVVLDLLVVLDRLELKMGQLRTSPKFHLPQ